MHPFSSCLKNALGILPERIYKSFGLLQQVGQYYISWVASNGHCRGNSLSPVAAAGGEFVRFGHIIAIWLNKCILNYSCPNLWPFNFFLLFFPTGKIRLFLQSCEVWISICILLVSAVSKSKLTNISC